MNGWCIRPPSIYECIFMVMMMIFPCTEFCICFLGILRRKKNINGPSRTIICPHKFIITRFPHSHAYSSLSSSSPSTSFSLSHLNFTSEFPLVVINCMQHPHPAWHKLNNKRKKIVFFKFLFQTEDVDHRNAVAFSTQSAHQHHSLERIIWLVNKSLITSATTIKATATSKTTLSTKKPLRNSQSKVGKVIGAVHLVAFVLEWRRIIWTQKRKRKRKQKYSWKNLLLISAGDF